MRKKIIILLAFIFIACTTSFVTHSSQRKVGGMGALPPRWTQGVTVYNKTNQKIEVRVDTGASSYTTIAPGKNKLIPSKGSGPKGVCWKQTGIEYETPKYGRPDYIEIKKNGVFNMYSLDKTVSKGTWSALETVPYLDQKAKKFKK